MLYSAETHKLAYVYNSNEAPLGVGLGLRRNLLRLGSLSQCFQNKSKALVVTGTGQPEG